MFTFLHAPRTHLLTDISPSPAKGHRTTCALTKGKDHFTLVPGLLQAKVLVLEGGVDREDERCWGRHV